MISLSGRSLEILIGTDPPVPFSVHEKLIRESSDFFDKAMSSDWKESRTHSVSLPDEDPEVFESYLHWIYCKKLPLRCEDPGSAEYLQLAKAIILGDRLQDADFEDAAIDAVIDKSQSSKMNGQALAPMITYIYKNTVGESGARRLLVDFYVCQGNKDWLGGPKGPRDLPPEFILDLATGLLERRPQIENGKFCDRFGTCKYHNHSSNGAICYKSKIPGPFMSLRAKLEKSKESPHKPRK